MASSRWMRYPMARRRWPRCRVIARTGYSLISACHGGWFAVAAASISSLCAAAAMVLTSSDIDDAPSEELRNCGAAAFVPRIELATADLHRLFAGEPKPGQDRR